MPNPATVATTSSRLLSTPELTVSEKTASSGCAVELCEAVTVTVLLASCARLLASCASKGAAGIKSKTMTRRRDIKQILLRSESGSEFGFPPTTTRGHYQVALDDPHFATANFTLARSPEKSHRSAWTGLWPRNMCPPIPRPFGASIVR